MALICGFYIHYGVVVNIAILIVEFSREEYKIRKVFGCSQIIEF